MRSGWHCCVIAGLAAAAMAACQRQPPSGLTFSGSALGPEAAVLQRQLTRFSEQHDNLPVELLVTPDAADQRHQLYVQRLNARSAAPDVLQLDVVWTAEFAGAGWLLPIGDRLPDQEDFVAAARTAATWRGTLYAAPWFVDLGLLYYRTDLVAAAPASLDGLRDAARAAQQSGATRSGFVWQGARYEGLTTVFLEHLGAFGGRILVDHGAVVVDEPAAFAALTFMRDAVAGGGFVPPSVLAWQEEQVRFAFQNGDAAFMRNWPYAFPLLQDPAQSAIAGRIAVAPFPPAAGGRPAAALGGAQLAVNAWSEHPALAMELVAFLTAPAQMLERAQLAGQLPARRAVYDDPRLGEALPVPVGDIRRILADAIVRPVTPVYSELSEILQVEVHRALSGQAAPAAALRQAAADMRALLARAGLQGPPAP